MLHHERLRPPSHDYPADERNVIEKPFTPNSWPQLETMLALGNGYLGMHGGARRKAAPTLKMVLSVMGSTKHGRSSTERMVMVSPRLVRLSAM